MILIDNKNKTNKKTGMTGVPKMTVGVIMMGIRMMVISKNKNSNDNDVDYDGSKDK